MREGHYAVQARQELEAKLAAAEAELARLREWQTLVVNGGDVARDRFVAGQYLTPVVEAWKAEVAKRDADIEHWKTLASEAWELADELISYVSDYFREKWEYDQTLAKLAQALGKETA